MRTSTVVLAISVALASVLLAWATMPSRPGATPRVRTTETFALGFDVPSVEAVRVVSGGEAAVLTRDGVDWSITLPTTSRGDGQGTTTWPANAEAARVLVNELATQSIEAGSDSGRNSGPSAGGDGDEPLAVVTIELPTGETTIAVTAAPIGGRLPVRITDSAGTSRRGFVAASRFRPTDAGQLAALAEPRPLATGGVVTEVRLAPRDGTGFAIERVGGLWQIAGGDPGGPSPRLHQPTVRGMLEDLESIRAASVIVPADVGPIDDPFLTIETVSDFPRTRGEARRQTAARLVVAGQSTLEGMTNAVAVRSGDEGDGGGGSGGDARLQIHLDAQAFPALPADVASLLDPVPLPWDARDTALISIPLSFPRGYGGNAQTRDFERTLDGWRLYDPVEPRAATAEESEAITALLGALTTPSTRVTLRPTTEGFLGLVLLESISGGAPVFLGFEPVSGELTDGATQWVTQNPTNDLIEHLRVLTPNLEATPRAAMEPFIQKVPTP